MGMPAPRIHPRCPHAFGLGGSVNVMNRFLIPSVMTSVALAVSVAVPTAMAAPKVENVKAGQFCKTADAGKTRIASNGARVKCVKVKGRYRWR